MTDLPQKDAARLATLIDEALALADLHSQWVVGAHLAAAQAALHGDTGPWSADLIDRAIAPPDGEEELRES